MPKDASLIDFAWEGTKATHTGVWTYSRRAADAALARFEEGAADYLVPLLAQRDALRAEVAAVQAHVQHRTATVDILRALGIALM